MADVEKIKNNIRHAIKTDPIIPTIIGDIIISGQIGEGGNSLVYTATWGKLEVAIKILAIDYQEEKDSEKYKRFIDEFHGLLPLFNTGVIVPIYYSGLFGEKFPFFVMEVYPETLDSWVKKNPIHDIHNLLPLIKRLLFCLNMIQRFGIIHRDIKPKNIFIDEYGKLVLGDFGIAWFDPEHYEKLAHTSAGDRLANYGFSAPEQFQKECSPAFSMDIFAVGQILQWMVTGNPHSGTARKHLGEIDESLRILDLFVDRLLSNDPNKRPQTAEEALKILEEIMRTKYEDSALFSWRSNYEFDYRLARAQPGGRGLIEIRGSQNIDQLLELLGQDPEKYELWWTRGIRNLHIYRLQKQTEGFWLMNEYEFNIESVWIYRHYHALYKNFVLIKTEPLPPFGFNEKSSESECAGYYKGFYFPREQFEDGIAIIEGQRIDLDSYAELRCRELKPNLYFFSIRTGNILYMQNDSIVESVYHAVVERGFINDEDIEMLNNTRKDPMLND